MTNKVVIPTSAVELEEMLNDPKVYAEVYADPEMRAEFQRKYASAALAKDPGLKQQLQEQVQLGLAEFMKDNGADPGNPLNRTGVSFRNGKPELNLGSERSISHGRGAVYNKYAPGALLEQASKPEDRFSAIGELCQAIREEARPTTNAKRSELLRKLEVTRSFQNSFGSEDPGSGGFLIPEEMRSELLQLALEDAIVRPRATVLPMSTLRVSVPSVDDTTHSTSLFGGVQFYWAEEASSLTESTATFGKVVLDAKKLTGFFKVPNETLADAPLFSSWFDTRIPAGLAWFEDTAFLTETGAGTPMGVVGTNNPAYVAVDRTTINVITYADLVTIYSRMLPTSLKNGVWIASIDAFPQLAQLTLSTPGVWMGGYNVPGVADAPPISIFGRPVIFTEKVPATGTSGGAAGDIGFYDLSYYLIGDRQAVSVSASEHAFFQNDMTAFRIIERADGRPWVQSALTPHNGGPTLSPYVGLSATHT